MRLINAAALINEAETGGWDVDKKELQMILKYVPTIDAMPVVRGGWEVDEFGHKCSACKEYCSDAFYEYDTKNYCPNCGARMEVEQ